MNGFILTTLVTTVVDLLIVEGYFLFVLRIKNPEKTEKIISVWLMFLALFFVLLFSIKVPLGILTVESTSAQRLSAEAPILLSSLYILIIKRSAIKTMQKKFKRPPV